jgi:hypothetical protein
VQSILPHDRVTSTTGYGKKLNDGPSGYQLVGIGRFLIPLKTKLSSKFKKFLLACPPQIFS